MSAQTAPTQYIEVKGTKLAYRRFGKPSPLPLLWITHFRGTMDLIDPLLLNSVAATRSLILLDNAGCGHSSGSIQPTIQEAAATIVDFLSVIGVSKVDVIGFSMGGFTAQVLALDYPNLVHKLVLAGTQSAYTTGFTPPDPSIMPIASQPVPTLEIMLDLFFFPSDTSRALGEAWWARLEERHVDGEQRTLFVDEAGAQLQNAAIAKFVGDAAFFARMEQLDLDVLITNGKKDVMTPTPNSWLMQQRMKRAELHIYPDSGHGHLYQFPERYARQLDLFLG
jgi:pimeloyl-ACP methyl ester carboxylesterase